ncbi:MAG: tRNA 2-thiouridine(34) synthase MnmA, partial [Proteobacteria bacterium]|nr:tRNA 2-thiouridine(34) synthase MnmA [Pseudomonadota bacterium]
KDAQSVCDELGIKLHRRNFSAEYWDHVFEDFLNEYKKGRTPNPDILCNREIKFKTFLDHAFDLGFTQMATGHYVRKDKKSGVYRLLKGKDNNKDQSYFLYTINQYQLEHSVFPVGELEKPEVRKTAAELYLEVHNKKDSTGICFIGEKRFQDFLSKYLQPNPGIIVNAEGMPIGKHTGLMYYTIGQRKGLGIGGVKDALPEPWFVVAKDHNKNQLIVTQGGQNPLILSTDLIAIEASWISGKAPKLPFACKAKVRYRQADQECIVKKAQNNSENLLVKFTQAQRAVTPGQSIVFYQADECLGGAIIDETNQLNQTCEFKKP